MRTRGGVRAVLIGFLWLLVGLAPTGASAAGGPVTGIAKDALDRPLPSAQVRLEVGDGRVVGQTTTDEQGRFSFPDVAPGTYVVVVAKDGFEAATAVVTVTEDAGASAALTLASRGPLDVAVAAKRLEEARISIQPRIGASTYEFNRQAIESLPQGDNAPLSQILLQAPGVTQDSAQSGVLHVRNEHANVQYRINGIALPDGVSLFGQSGGLSPRFANSVELITGALPAEFGLRTAGIVDVQTKSGAFGPGGYIGMYGGSHSWIQPSAEYRARSGASTTISPATTSKTTSASRKRRQTTRSTTRPSRGTASATLNTCSTRRARSARSWARSSGTSRSRTVATRRRASRLTASTASTPPRPTRPNSSKTTMPCCPT